MLDPPGECRQKKAEKYATPVITKALRIDLSDGNVELSALLSNCENGGCAITRISIKNGF